MKIDIDELSPVQRKVRVELPAETVANEFSRAYKNLGQRVRVKGFRSGKIPRRVLQGIYGDDVKSEVRSHLVEESLGEVIKERGLQIVSRPEVESHDLLEDGEFSFSAGSKLNRKSRSKITWCRSEKPRISITDEQVDEAPIDCGKPRQLALVDDRDEVQKGDSCRLTLKAPSPVNRSRRQGRNYTLEVGTGNALPQSKTRSQGESRERERSRLAIRNLSEQGHRRKAVDFSIVVREIKQKVLPMLDDEFARIMANTVSRRIEGGIRKRLEEELKHYQDEQLKEQLLGQLIESHSFAVPPSMVDRQTRYLMERYQKQMADQAGEDKEPAPPQEEARKALESRANRQVQATLLIERIAQREHIEVGDKDLQDRVEKTARAAGERAKTVREYYSRPDAATICAPKWCSIRRLIFYCRASIKESIRRPSRLMKRVKNARMPCGQGVTNI